MSKKSSVGQDINSYSDYKRDPKMRKMEENNNTGSKQSVFNSYKSISGNNKSNSVGKSPINGPMNSYYQENRIQNMSHIRQLNPKNKNFIIPVLPSNFFRK